MQTKFWENKYVELSSLAVSSLTWKSRMSSFNKLKAFAKDTNSDISWPLNQETRNGFIMWCYARGSVSENTVVKYLTHLNSIQSFLGFKKFENNKNLSTTLLKGLKNAKNSKNKVKVNKKAVTFKTLKIIKTKLKNEFGKSFIFYTYWTACCIAFFRCFRLGEILSKNPHVFDNKFELMWKDVKIHKKSISINVKSPKSTPRHADKIYLFNFKFKKLCPVRSMKKLKKLQLSNELFSKDFPVFRLEQHTFLTQKDINRFLKSSFKNSYIRGHSFRAGIPTTIANFPDIANDNHIMGWGRWRSKKFSTYQKAKKNQKRWVFRKIEKALLQE